MSGLSTLWEEIVQRTDYERCERPRAARLSLDEIGSLLQALGSPHAGPKILHVGGSKGKGTVCHYLEKGLRASGLRTGLYTSPHFQDWRERIQLDGQWAGDVILEAALRDVLEASSGEETFFDLLTAAAFLVFSRAEVDFWVVEVGLGGRLDSTNVLQPLASVVTSVELEHEDVLGPGLANIAREKAGIFKPGVPAWAGEGIPSEALAVLVEASPGLRLSSGPGGEFLPHAPARANWKLARCVLAALPGVGVQAAKAFEALSADALSIPGRWDVRTLPDGRIVVLDNAHSVTSLVQVLRTFRASFPEKQRGLVLGLRDDKDAEAIAAALGGPLEGESWFCAPAGEHPRSADPNTISSGFGATALSSPTLPEGPEVFLVTGSTYLVGAVLDSLPQSA